MLKFAILLTAFAMTLSVSAQTTAGAAAPAAAATPTAISPEKDRLIHRILQLWHVENVGVLMLQKPVAESLRQSRSLLQGRVSSETQEAAMKDISEDARKFLDETIPVVRSGAEKLIPSTVVPILAEKFTEEELRQVVAILESPVKSKFESVVPELEKALGEKIAAESGPMINAKLTELTEKIGLRMRAAVTP